MTAKRLTVEEAARARAYVRQAQAAMKIASDALTKYYQLTGDVKVFRIIDELQGREGQREDCLGYLFNLNDLLRRLYEPEEQA